MPRLRLPDDRALPGAAIAGPIGGGKTFIFEAVASELDMPVLVLKNIRSQWFGQTDVIFERLKRVLEALEKVCIFVDEADTQFGGVGEGAHETERRLTGKVQGMMSDPKLRGKVIWLLMTARIHLCRPIFAAPGRVGDLIIPVLDPEGDDRREFIRWMLKPSGDIGANLMEWLDKEGLPPTFSAAGYSALRSQIKALPPKNEEELRAIVRTLFSQPLSRLADTKRCKRWLLHTSQPSARSQCDRRAARPVGTRNQPSRTTGRSVTVQFVTGPKVSAIVNQNKRGLLLVSIVMQLRSVFVAVVVSASLLLAPLHHASAQQSFRIWWAM